MKSNNFLLGGMIVCLVVFVFWGKIGGMLGLAPAGKPAEPAQQAQTAQTVSGGTAAAPVPASAPAAPPKVLDAGAIVEPPVEIGDDKLTLTFDPASGVLTRIRLNHMQRRDVDDPDADSAMVIENQCAPLQLAHPGAFGTYEPSGWTLLAVEASEPSGDAYLLRRRLRSAEGQEFVLEQRWSIAGDYRIDYRIRVINDGAEPLELERFTVDGGDLSNWQFFSGDEVRSERHYVNWLASDGTFNDITPGDKNFARELNTTVKWLGVSNKYLALLLKGEQDFNVVAAREKLDSGKRTTGIRAWFFGSSAIEYWVVAFGARYPAVTVAPGEEAALNFSYYAGPKLTGDLAAFDAEASRVLYFGGGPLNILSKFLLEVLLWFHSWCGSYGWAIIMLTLLVRLLLYPITLKANRSMGKMRDVQPQLMKLREKYKDNQQLMAQKQMELYREAGVNPFGGCLPLVIQIPIFIGLYQTLEGAVQLRQESFLWIRDLAAPDTVAVIMNFPIHPLVLVMTALMVVQQRITPMAMEGMQKKIMMLMPLFMLLLLYNLPSGLTLYWTVSSLFSIAQMLLQRKLDKQTHLAGAAVAAPAGNKKK